MANNNYTNKDEQLASHIRQSAEHPLVVIFSATWHSHSAIVEIISEKIEQADKNINVIIFDADKDENIFIRYNIGKIPSALIIKDKKMIRKVEGTFSKKMILDLINA